MYHTGHVISHGTYHIGHGLVYTGAGLIRLFASAHPRPPLLLPLPSPLHINQLVLHLRKDDTSSSIAAAGLFRGNFGRKCGFPRMDSPWDSIISEIDKRKEGEPGWQSKDPI